MLKTSICRIFLLIVALVGGFNEVICQDVARANWYFGANNNSIQFTRPMFDAERITLPNTLGVGGGAVATDPVKSQVLFYTDGINVYNQNDVLLNAGNPLAGSTTRNQGTVICHDPADTDNSRILIFTIDDAGTISQSAFDKANSFNSAFPLPPDGAMAEINVTTDLPATPLSEGMVIVPNDTETGFWLITHNAGLSSFNITQIDATGISTIAQTTIAGSPTVVNNLTYHEVSNRIGVSPGPGESIILLDIDLATGALTNAGVDLSFLASPASNVFDMDWITSGDSLYISGDFGNATDDLFRVDLTATPINNDAIDTVLTTDVNNSFGLSYGPDGFLYHLYEASSDGEFKVGRIEIPDTTDIRQILYNPIALRDPVTFDPFNFEAEQFPSFLPRYDLLQNIDFTFSGTCMNVPTYFFPQVAPDIDQIVWDFGDMQGTANGISPSYTYVAAGPFDVSMTATINGVSRTVTNTITITEFDLTIQIDPMQQYWCPEDFPVTYTASAQGTSAEGAVFRWSNQTQAEANEVTSIEEPGTYFVIATDPVSGCEAYMEQQVIEYGTVNNFANAWYFGSNAGIDFNPLFDEDDPFFPSIQAITPTYQPDKFLGGNQINFGPDNDLAEGVAIFCDQGGRPIVYSNGMEVWNRDNDLIETNLGGDPLATQSVFITVNPADATVYYIFYTKEVPNAAGSYEFGYAIFDLKLRSGGGDLVRLPDGSVNTTTLFNCNSERITGNGAWVVVHEFGNNNFRAYPVTALGIGSPVISNVGRSHELINNGSTARGYMKLNGTRLAVAVSESLNDNFIDLFDFDLTTGEVTENLVIDIENETGEIYGLEYSTENIFATLRNSDGGTKVLWWDLIDNTVDPTVALDEAGVNASIITITDQPGIDLGAMQIGPDGAMYIANSGATNLASIGNPDVEPTSNGTAAGEVGFTLSAPPDLQARSTIGLPNFVDFNGTSQPRPTLQVNNGCEGDKIDITVANPLDDADREIENYLVIIIDPNGSQVASIPLDEENPSSTFGQTQLTGVYQAEFYILNECNSDVIQSVQNFTINELPNANITAINQPSDCGLNDRSVTVDFLTAAGLSYSVSGATAVAATGINGPASDVVIPNLSAGSYSLNVTVSATGCRATIPFTIDDPVAYQVQLTESSAADCNNENGLLAFNFTGGPAPTGFNWTIRNQLDNSFVESGDETTIPTASIGAGTYTITILDSDGCTVVGDGIVTGPNLIELSVDPGPFSACDAESITINITTNGEFPVELREINGNVISDTPINNFSVIGDNDSIRVTNPSAGSGTFNYALVAPGDLDGPCTNTTTISVSFGTSSPGPYPSRVAICPDEVIFERTFSSFDNQPDGFQNVRWFTASGVEIIQTSATDSVTNVAGYFYSIDGSEFYTFNTEPVVAELTNLEGCITTSEINVIEDCRARINAPTAFSPNGDGINDGFILFPFLIAEEDFEFFLFNRWGELVFQTDDLRLMTEQGGWNGSYNNDPSRPLTGGGYAYKVVFKSSVRPEEGTEEQRGGVTLIR